MTFEKFSKVAVLPILALAFFLALRTITLARAYYLPNGGEPLKPEVAFYDIPKSDIRYVAIGDSYTCGTGIEARQSWAYQLIDALRKEAIPVGLAANLAVDGWTTDNVIKKALPLYTSQHPAFVTVMVGVNDTYTGTTAAEFQSRLHTLLDAVQKPLVDKSRVILVTIPDYSVTPTGKWYAKEGSARQNIDTFNAILRKEANARHLPLVDVTTLSRQMTTPDLQAADQLHPSAKEHALWAAKILPVARRFLRSPR